MILKNDQKEDISRRIDFIETQLGDLKQFQTLDWQLYREDRDVQRNIERLVENVANAAIDIAKIVIAGEDVEMPNSYRDIILKLADIKVLDAGLAAEIAENAGLRNILAHQYLDIRWDRIKKFIQKAPQIFPKFIQSLAPKLK